MAATQGRLNRLETRWNDLSKEILAVDPGDLAEAERYGADAARIFPEGALQGVMPDNYGEESDYSVYSFLEIGRNYFETAIEYRDNYLQVSHKLKSMGFIANLGGSLVETIGEQDKEFVALATYEVPKDPETVRNEYSSNGQTFRSKAPVVAGNSYLLRVFNAAGDDGIFALKIQRVDSDSSIVLFVRKIKDLSRIILETSNPPPIPGIADYGLEQELTNALIQQGFFNVTVEATITEVTLRGTVPRGKMAEAMQTAQETAKRKINNQLTEQ